MAHKSGPALSPAPAPAAATPQATTTAPTSNTAVQASLDGADPAATALTAEQAALLDEVSGGTLGLQARIESLRGTAAGVDPALQAHEGGSVLSLLGSLLQGAAQVESEVGTWDRKLGTVTAEARSESLFTSTAQAVDTTEQLWDTHKDTVRGLITLEGFGGGDAGDLIEWVGSKTSDIEGLLAAADQVGAVADSAAGEFAADVLHSAGNTVRDVFAGRSSFEQQYLYDELEASDAGATLTAAVGEGAGQEVSGAVVDEAAVEAAEKGRDDPDAFVDATSIWNQDSDLETSTSFQKKIDLAGESKITATHERKNDALSDVHVFEASYSGDKGPAVSLSGDKKISATEGMSIDRSYGASYADGKATAHVDKGTTVTEDGITTKNTSGLTASHGEDGTRVGAHHTRAVSDDLSKTTTEARASWNPAKGVDGIDAKLARSTETEVEGQKNGSNVALTLDNGNAALSGGTDTAITAEDGTRRTESRKGAITRRQSGDVDVEASTATDTHLEHGDQKVSTSKSASMKAGTDGSFAIRGATAQEVTEGDTESASSASGSASYDAKNGLTVGFEGAARDKSKGADSAKKVHARWAVDKGIQGVDAGVESTRKTTDDAGGSTSTVTRAGVQDGKASLARTATASARDGDASIETSHSASGSVDGDGNVLLGGSAGSSRKDDVGEASTAAAASWDSSKGIDGITAKVDHSRKLGDDKDGQSRNVALAAKDGAVSVQGGNSAYTTDEAGVRNETSKSGSAGLDKDGNLSAAGALASKRSDDVSTTSRSASAAYKDGKASATFKSAKELHATPDDRIKTENTATLTSDGASAGRTTSTRHTDEDGAKHTSSSSSNASWDGETASASHNRSTSVQRKDGSSSSSSGGATLDSDGNMGLQGSTVDKDAEGKVKTAASGSASVKVGAGGIEEVNAAGTLQKGNLDASASGKVINRASEKENPDGTWTVEQVTGVGGNLSGGAKAGGADDGFGGNKPGANASVELGGSTTHNVTRVLSKAEYAAYKETGQLPERTLDNLETWNVGEAISDASSSKLGASGGVDGAGLGAGAGASHSSSSSLAVRKTDDNTVEIDLAEGSATDLSGNLSGGPAKMEVGNKTTSSSTRTLALDLNDPNWKLAYAYIKKHKKAPPPEMGGFKVISSKDAQSDQDRVKAGLAGNEVSVTSETSNSIETDRDGNTIERDAGKRGAGVKTAWGATHAIGDSLEMHQRNNGENVYTAKSTVMSNDAESSKQALARAAGVKLEEVGERDGDGKTRDWTVAYSFSDKQVDQFMGLVGQGTADSTGLSPYKKDEADVLRKLAAETEGMSEDAKRDHLRKALASFVANGGSGALAMMRDNVGITGDVDFQLKGDKYFDGGAWKRQTDDVIARIRAELDANEPNARAARRWYRDQVKVLTRRIAAVGNAEQYPDLPRAVRRQEKDSTNSYLARLRELKQPIRDLIRSENTAAKDEVDDTMGNEVDLAFGGPAQATALALAKDQTATKPLGPVREDYVPEEQPTTEDLVKEELRSELAVEQGENNDKQDTADKGSDDIRDETDSDGRKDAAQARRFANKHLARVGSANGQAGLAMGQYYWAAGKKQHTEGMELYTASSTKWAKANDRLASGDRHLDSGDFGKAVKEYHIAASLAQGASYAAKKAVKLWKSIPASSAPWYVQNARTMGR